MKTRSLLDLLPEDKRQLAIDRAKKRNEKRKARKGLDVSPEFFDVAEFGYYYGWEAVLAARRGFTVVPVTGERELFSYDEMQLLLEAARKVWYVKLIETAGAGMTSTGAAFSKTPRQTLEDGLEPLKKAAELRG